MQCNRICPNCGADMADDSTPAPDIGRMPHVEERGVRLGPPLVEHQGNYLGRPFGLVGIDDVGIPMIDK